MLGQILDRLGFTFHRYTTVYLVWYGYGTEATLRAGFTKKKNADNYIEQAKELWFGEAWYVQTLLVSKGDFVIVFEDHGWPPTAGLEK